MKLPALFSIRFKIFIGFILLLTLAFFVEWFIYTLTRQYIYSQVHAIQLEKARSSSIHIRNLLYNVDAYNGKISTAYRSDPTKKEVTVVANSIIQHNNFIQKIIIRSLSGNELVRFANTTAPNEQDFSAFREQFEQARTGTQAYSNVYYTGDSPYMDIFYPIFSGAKPSAVLQIEINLSDFWDTISQFRLGGGYAYIVDSNGTIIAHPDALLTQQRRNVSDRPIVTSMLSTGQNDTSVLRHEDTMYTNEKGVEVTAQAIKVQNVQWFVLFEEPIEIAFSFIEFMKKLVLGTLVLSLLVLFGVAYFISKNLTTSIIKLQTFTKLIEEGRMDERISIKSNDEIESLGNSINHMAEIIHEREQLLQKDKQQTETILHSLSDAVIATDKNNNIILFNQSAGMMLSLKREDVVGKSIDEVFSIIDNETQLSIRQYTEKYNDPEQLALSNRVSITLHSGKQLAIELKISPVFSANGSVQSGWIVTFSDISKEHVFEEMKQDFITLTAHKLRTPLTSLSGYLSVLQREAAGKLSEDERSFLERSQISAKLLVSMTEDLLTISEIEQRKLQLNKVSIDLLLVTKNVCNDLLPFAKDHQIELHVEERSSVPKVMADEIKMNEVIKSLITNGIIYNNPGGWVKVSFTADEHTVTMVIADNGVGIPNVSLPHLFTKFFRIAKPLTMDTNGNGLSLYFAKSIIEAHRGKISVTSEEGIGSTFTFSLQRV